MEIRLLDQDFQLRAIIDEFESLIWNRKYYDVGDFELHLGETYMDLLDQDIAYLIVLGEAETGIVEEFTWEQDKHSLSLKGRFLEQRLNNLVIHNTLTETGTPEAINRELMNAYYVDLKPECEILPEKSIGTPVSLQTTGATLKDVMYNLVLSQEQSIRFTYDYYKQKAIFETWAGTDRTTNQQEHAYAVFSEDFGTLLSAKYTKSSKDYKNYAYIVGEDPESWEAFEVPAGYGDWAEWKKDYYPVIVDKTADGENRCEIWIDANGTKREDTDDMKDVENYLKLLKDQAAQKLAEYLPTQGVEVTLNPYGSLQYKEGFDLGDLCTVISRGAGIRMDQRITEITRVYEGCTESISLVVGSSEKTIMERIKREVTNGF